MKVEIIMVAYERYEELEMAIRSIRLQTNPNWVLHIVYDGKAPQGIIDCVAPYLQGGARYDTRIHFYESPERYQKYGHPNRRAMLQAIQCEKDDYIMMTNDDNYYVPKTIEFILNEARHKAGIIFWDTVHSHMEYNLHVSQLQENWIDMASFVVRADIAKDTGFNHDHFSADGTYATECHHTCRARGASVIKIKKPLLVHN